MRAVIFDLWDTLVDYDVEHSRATERRIAELLGVEPEAFHARWREGRTERDAGTLADSFREICVPRPGAVETLRELRRRGLKLGLISVCSEEVALLWDETPFAGLFDSTVSSCSGSISTSGSGPIST